MPRSKRETVRLSVSKGREASLNRAIIQALISKEPQTTNQLFTKIAQIEEFKDISYSTVNKRVRSLEQSGYIKKVLVKKRAGGLSNYYELRPKVYLAQFLASNSIYKLLEKVDDQLALTILNALIQAKTQETKPKNSETSKEKIDT